MRTLPFDPNSEGIAFLITIQRGLETIRFTTADRPITLGGFTWQPEPGCIVTNLQFTSDVTAANCDIVVKASPEGIIETGDAAKGLFDYWPITVDVFNLTTGIGTFFDLIPGASIGSALENARNEVTIAANGPLTKATTNITEHYSLEGRETLGDDRCKVPIMPPDIARSRAYVPIDFNSGDLPGNTGMLRVEDVYGVVQAGGAVGYAAVEAYNNVYYECIVAGTTDSFAPDYPVNPGDTVDDGTATFLCRNSWTRHVRGHALATNIPTSTMIIQLDYLPDPRATDPTWYMLGGIYLRSGKLAGYPKLPIRIWDPNALQVGLFLPVDVAHIPDHTAMLIHAGCDWTRDTCTTRFDVPDSPVRQIWNIRAEYFTPPPETKIALGGG